MTGSIRGILFDKDGTLVDAFAGWIDINRRLFDDLKTHHGGTASRYDLDAALGVGDDRVLPGGLIASGTEDQIYRAHHRLLGSSAPAWEDFLPEVRKTNAELFRRSPPVAQPLGSVGATLVQLRATGYRLGVATSDSEPNARRDLERHGAEAIEFWATPDRIEHPKPHPQSVLLFAEFLGVATQAIAFVGDSLVDLQAARAAGVGLFVAVGSATCPAEVLQQADHVITTIDELPALLNHNR